MRIWCFSVNNDFHFSILQCNQLFHWTLVYTSLWRWWIITFSVIMDSWAIARVMESRNNCAPTVQSRCTRMHTFEDSIDDNRSEVTKFHCRMSSHETVQLGRARLLYPWTHDRLVVSNNTSTFRTYFITVVVRSFFDFSEKFSKSRERFSDALWSVLPMGGITSIELMTNPHTNWEPTFQTPSLSTTMYSNLHIEVFITVTLNYIPIDENVITNTLLVNKSFQFLSKCASVFLRWNFIK